MTWHVGVVAWRTSLFWRINRGGEDLRLIDRWKQARVGGQRGSRGIWSWEIYGAGDRLRGRGRYVRGEMMHKWNKDERIERKGGVCIRRQRRSQKEKNHNLSDLQPSMHNFKLWPNRGEFCKVKTDICRNSQLLLVGRKQSLEDNAKYEQNCSYD